MIKSEKIAQERERYLLAAVVISGLTKSREKEEMYLQTRIELHREKTNSVIRRNSAKQIAQMSDATLRMIAEYNQQREDRAMAKRSPAIRVSFFEGAVAMVK